MTKLGPRGGIRKSGACSCDAPSLGSVAAVRQFAKDLGKCRHCGDDGLQLLGFVGRPMHVRCIVRSYGISVLAQMPEADRRVRLCCLTKRQWKEWAALVEKRRPEAPASEKAAV